VFGDSFLKKKHPVAIKNSEKKVFNTVFCAQKRPDLAVNRDSNILR
jgi:hypothetical protein